MSFPLPNSVADSPVVLGILFLTAVLGCFFIWRRTGGRLRRGSEKAESKTQRETEGHPPDLGMSVVPPDKVPESSLQKVEGGAEESALRRLAASAREENLRELLEARLDDMEDEAEGVPRALAMIGLLDEIRILSPASAGQDARLLQKIDAVIRKQLEMMGAQAIDDDEWDSSRQKAVEVRRDLPAGAEPVIAEKVASGLMFEGRVRRKQSVILRMEP